MSGADLLRGWFSEFWNEGNFDAADKYVAPEAVIHEPAFRGDGVQTIEEFKAMARIFKRAIPNIRYVVDGTLEDEDRAAARVTVTGTHTGPGIGTAPSNRSFRTTGMTMVRIANGRVVEAWSNFDMLGQFEQLGLVQRPKIGAD